MVLFPWCRDTFEGRREGGWQGERTLPSKTSRTDSYKVISVSGKTRDTGFISVSGKTSPSRTGREVAR